MEKCQGGRTEWLQGGRLQRRMVTKEEGSRVEVMRQNGIRYEDGKEEDAGMRGRRIRKVEG